jgi:signal transduction histidine kinase
LRRLIERLRRWADSLFGRLALLLMAFTLASHVLALTMLFELAPRPLAPGPQPLPPAMLADIGLRLLALLAAAWIAARWVSRPMRRLAAAAEALRSEQGLVQRAEGLGELPVEGPCECRQAAQTLNRLLAQVREHMQHREHFVAAVSHDLRTPLTRLRLRAELLDDAGLRDSLRREVIAMDDTLRTTLDYLLGASAAEPFEPCDVSALAARLAADLRAIGGNVEFDGHAPPWRVQPLALRRALENLVSNALRHAGDARILLVVEPDEGGQSTLCLSVRDHGPGLSDDELTRVLQPFYRTQRTRRAGTEGRGLGLAIAADIVHHHGGTLRLSPAPGGGLLAQIRLPQRTGT